MSQNNVEAIEWTGSNVFEIKEFLGEHVHSLKLNELIILSGEKMEEVEMGDFIVKDKSQKLKVYDGDLFSELFQLKN